MVARRFHRAAERGRGGTGRRQQASFLEQLGGFARRASGARQLRGLVEGGRDIRVRPGGGKCEVTGALLRVPDAGRESSVDVAALSRTGVGVRGGGQQRMREADASAADGDELGVDGRPECRRTVAPG